MIYSFDPGKITGFAVGDPHGKLYNHGQYDKENLYKFLDGINDATLFIIEKFTIRPNKASSFIWSDMEVIQIIGALHYAAHRVGAHVRMQEPSIKPLAYKWSGIQVPKNHSLSHSTDAYVHLVHYWVKILGHMPPALKDKNGKEEN